MTQAPLARDLPYPSSLIYSRKPQTRVMLCPVKFKRPYNRNMVAEVFLSSFKASVHSSPLFCINPAVCDYDMVLADRTAPALPVSIRQSVQRLPGL